MKLANKQITDFQTLIWDFYTTHGRHDLPWRLTDDPYKIYVSEIMLQQTQVSRVLPHYKKFIGVLPHFESLASVDSVTLLKLWQGLGYNARALHMRLSAQTIVDQFGGKLPNDYETLLQLAGIGPSTAGSLMSFVFDKPITFIETNIRRVFIYQFRKNAHQIPDSELLPLVTATLPAENFRQWYWALMDYGSFLARTKPNANRVSRHYTKQSKFSGSHRQVRGEVIRVLLNKQPLSFKQLSTSIPDARLACVLEELVREGFLTHAGQDYQIN